MAIRLTTIPPRNNAMTNNGINASLPSATGQKQAVALTPVIRSTKVTITSAPGGGANASTTVYLFNNDYLQTIDDNGSGAASITYNYEDGFTGVLTSRMITQANNGQGQILYGGYIEAYAAGVADPTGLSNSEPQILQYTGRGTSAVPTIIEVDDNFSRSDFSTGIGVFTCEQPFNVSTQIQLDIAGAAAATTYVIVVKLYFYPNFKI